MIGMTAQLFQLPGISAKGLLPPGKAPLNMPCILDDFEVAEEAEIRDYSTVGSGDFSQSGGSQKARKPQAFQMDILCLEYQAPFLARTGKTPKQIEEALRAVLRSRSPIGISVIQFNPNPTVEVSYGRSDNGGVTMRTLTRTRKAGSPEALWLTASFVEWRNPGLPTGTRASNGVQLPTNYKPVGADTLWSISLKFYGTYKHWRIIANVNGLRNVPPSKKLHGVVPFVRIPRKPTPGKKG